MTRCHSIFGSNDDAEIQIGGAVIKNSNHGKLLGVKIDKKLNFDGHAKSVCEKTSSILSRLSRITP